MMGPAGAFNQTSPFSAILGPNSPAALGSVSLFVKGLAKGVNERQLHAIFSAFGSVVDCQVARHRSGRSAGFAVVTFFRREDAQRALVVMESAVLAGRRLNVRWYTPELQQSTLGMGDLSVAQALAAMLGGQQQAPPSKQQQQAPWMTTPDAAAAAAQLLLVQQLANAVAASRTASATMPGVNAPVDSWAALTVTNPAVASPRMQQSVAHGTGDMCGKPAMLPTNWLDTEAPHNLHAQLDNWARHSVDTSAPTYGPRRRSTHHCSRLSLEGADLLNTSGGTSTHDELDNEEHVEGLPPAPGQENSKWLHGRSGASRDGSAPLASPNDQSEDGSGLTGHTAHVSLKHTMAKHQDEDISESGVRSNCIQLPPDSDSLFDRQPSLTSSSLSSLRSSTTGNANGINHLNGPLANGKHQQKHGISNLPAAFAAPGGPMIAPVANAPLPGPGALRAPGHGAEMREMDLAAALGLSGLSLDGHHHGAGIAKAHGMPSHMHMEAAMRQAQQADNMIAQLSAMRSQALMAYHALQQQQPVFGHLPGLRPGMMGPGAAAQAPSTPYNIEAMLASGALSPGNLESLSQLAAMLPHGMHGATY